MSEMIQVSMVADAYATETKPVQLLTLLREIKNGRWKLRQDVIRKKREKKLRETNGDLKAAKAEIKKAKEALPAVTFAGLFSYRENDDWIVPSGLLPGDLDNLDSDLAVVREKLRRSPHLFFDCESVTGSGLRAVFKIPIGTRPDEDRYHACFEAVRQHVIEICGVEIDPACKDPVRLSFVCADSNARWNLEATPIALLPAQPQKAKNASSTSRTQEPLTKEQVRDMLRSIPKRPDYADWIRVVAGVGDGRPDEEAIELLNEWSAEESPGEYAEKLRKRLKDVRIGSLIHLAKEHGWTPPKQWQDPQPLPEDMPAVPPFDFDCLPDTLRPWIEDISERMQCPPDFPAVGAMIALGSVIGRKIGIRPKRHDDWMEIANLWGCIIGRVGLLKTPALQQALVHLRHLAARAFEQYEREIRDHEISAILIAQSKKIVEETIKKHLRDNKEAAARGEAEKHLKAANEKPVCRRYSVNDSTIEKLGELLAENPNGLLLVRDELSGFLRSLDREEKAGDRAKYLEMWDGKGELTYDRIGRGTVRVPSNTLSILGGIQPDVITSYVREAVRGGTGNDGLMQRFQLFVWPDVPKEWINVDEWPDTEAKNKAFDVFEYLDNLTPETVGASTSDGIPFLRFSADAQECFDAWRSKLEKKLRSDTEHPAFEAHLAKYRKLLPALALLIHLADRQTGAVCLDALNKALLWVNYLEAHARRIYSAVLCPDTAAARELAKHLQRGDLSERFKLREVYRKGWTGLSTKEDAEAATEILCDLDWIRAAVDASERVPGAPGRASSQAFEINPKILGDPYPPTDKTDTINSGSSVSDALGVSEKSEAAQVTAETVDI